MWFLVNRKLHVSQQCVLAAWKVKYILGCIKREVARRASEEVIHRYSTLAKPHLEYCIQTWDPGLGRCRALGMGPEEGH